MRIRPIAAHFVVIAALSGGCRSADVAEKQLSAGAAADQTSLAGQGPAGDALKAAEAHDGSTQIGHDNAVEDRKFPTVRPAGFLAEISPEGADLTTPDAMASHEGMAAETIEPLPQSVWTLASVERTALENSPVLTEASARVEAARGEWVQAGLPPNLRLGYLGSEIGNEGAAGQQGGLLAQEFITGGKLRLGRNREAWRIRRLEQQWEATRLRLLTDVRIGFFDVLLAQRRRELAEKLVHVSEQGAEAAEALFRGAEVSEADPLRAQIDVDNARIVLQNSINQQAEAWRRMAALMGMPELDLQPVEGKVAPDEFEITDWTLELRRLLSESPEIAAAIAEVQSAQWAIERAYAEVVPNVDVQSSVQKDDASGYTIAGLQIELPLPLLNRNQGGIRAAQAEATAAVRNVDRVALDLQTRLADAYQRYQSARNQVDQYSRNGGILDKSQRTLDLIRAGYQAEEFGVLDLLTAQRTFFQTNLAYLDSLREMAASATEIRGLLLTGSLSSHE